MNFERLTPESISCNEVLVIGLTIVQDNSILAFNVEPEGNPLTVSSPFVIKGELQELKKEGKVKVHEAESGNKAKKSITVHMAVKK